MKCLIVFDLDDTVAGSEPSAGSVGNSYDKALAETINGLYKAEVIHRRGPSRSFEAVEYATLEWVDLFNHRRLLEPICNMSPAAAEDQYYAAADNIEMAARLTTHCLRQTRRGSFRSARRWSERLRDSSPRSATSILGPPSWQLQHGAHQKWRARGRPPLRK